MLSKAKLHILLVVSVQYLVLSTVSCLDINKAYTQTSSGGIQGYHKNSENGRQYLAFEGIPYAQPPIGELRFKVK